MTTGLGLIAAMDMRGQRIAPLRVRKAPWAPGTYGRVTVVQHDPQTDVRRVGPWFQLFDRPSQGATGAPTPEDVAMVDWPTSFVEDTWELYEGPLDPADIAPAGDDSHGGA